MDTLYVWLNELARVSHRAALKWWQNPQTGERIERNKGELIALMHSELSEMLEGVRKGKQDEHLPQFLSEHVELADLLIRAFDYAGAYHIDLTAIVKAKMLYNAQRADHTHEARLADGGKRF